MGMEHLPHQASDGIGANLAARQAAHLALLDGVAGKRQIGTITAMEFAVSDAGYLATIGPTLLRHFREQNILLRPMGNTVYVMPPYCIDDEDLGAIYDAISSAVRLA